jgi:hypothetical protein
MRIKNDFVLSFVNKDNLFINMVNDQGDETKFQIWP